MLAMSKATSPHLDYKRFRVSTKDDYDNRCIAPAQRKDRCDLLIDAEEAREVVDLTFEVRQSSVGPGREKLLHRLILLRCCGEYHRQKLEADHINLEKVARRYDELLNTIDDCTLKRYEAVHDGKEDTPQASKVRYHLRPRYAEDQAEELCIDKELSLFTPYRSSPRDSVEGCLVDDVSVKDRRQGFVYALSWPTNPDYLKLGSSVSLSDRLAALQRCYPRAEFLHRIKVPFPRRVERLIHLEMSRVRYQMILCHRCGRTHLEWFKKNITEMKFIMDTWEKLFDKDMGLYDEEGKMSSDWKQKIRKTQHELTAKRLMGIVSSLLPKSQEISTTGAPQHSTNPVGPQTLENKSQDQIKHRDWDIVAEYFYDFRLSIHGTEGRSVSGPQ